MNALSSAAATPVAPLLYESHSHTTLCKHSVGHPEEFAAVGFTRGLKGLIVTCHSPMPNGYSSGVRMSPEQFPEYVELVRGVTESWAGRMDVLLGMESDYLPGAEDWLKKLHSRAEFHYILGSVHPHVAEYKKLYYTGDPFDYQKLYFEHLAQAAETGLFDSLAHPDLIKNEKPMYWKLEKIMPYIVAALDRIAATGVAMELNTSGLNKSLPEMNPGPVILKEIAARGIPIVLGADAHRPTRVADKYEEALGMLKEAGFSSIQVFRHRKPQIIAIDDALHSLRPIVAPATATAT